LQLFSQHVALHAVALSFSLFAAVSGYRLCVSRCLLRAEENQAAGAVAASAHM
jgi:hypothetical protein